jgi:hypothetical protein
MMLKARREARGRQQLFFYMRPADFAESYKVSRRRIPVQYPGEVKDCGLVWKGWAIQF